MPRGHTIRNDILLLMVVSMLGFAAKVGLGMAQAGAVAIGKRIYTENCAACHGENVDGKGPQASRLKTKPFPRKLFRVTLRKKIASVTPLEGPFHE